GTDRRKILGVRKQHDPIIADPVVEADFAFGGFGFEIRGGVANRKSHGESSVLIRCSQKAFRRHYVRAGASNTSLLSGNIPLSDKYYSFEPAGNARKIV